MNNIRQFKLTTGEELSCQILEWADDEEVDIVIRHVYEINRIDDDARGYRYYNLKPWMVMQEGDDKFITLNTMHIVSQCKADEKIVEQFQEAVKNSQLTEEELQEKVEKYLKKMKAVMEDEVENIIRFPNSGKNDKLH